MTRKLFYEEPDLLEFEASVVLRIDVADRPAVVLDRTAFYATSGGQPFDSGTIDGARVLDVFEAPQGIVHVLERPVEAARVRGKVDAGRRLDHSQQHHGQHILSAALMEVCDAQTVSFHLGGETCTIDLDREPTPDRLAQAEALANRVIGENRPVTVSLVPRAQAEAMKIRKLPEGVEGPLRIVSIEGLDVQPCSGTHPSATGRVGAVAVIGIEKVRGGTRLTFVCGGRVARALSESARRLRAISAMLSVPPADAEAALARRIEEERSLRRRLADLEKETAEREARDIFERGETAGGLRWCVEEVRAEDLGALKALALETLSRAESPVAVLLAASSPKGCLFCAGTRAGGPDLASAMKEMLRRTPGKGGGAPSFVQGNFASGSPREILDQFRLVLGKRVS